MFGCGYFHENEMLLYLEGKSLDTEAIESHLKICPSCLEEVIEQNRIDAKTSVFKPGALARPFLINLLIGGGSVIRALSTEGDVKLFPLAETRSGKGPALKAVYNIDKIPAVLRVLPSGSGSCRINLSSPLLKSASVEIRRKGDKLPLYSKKSDRAEVTFKGIGPGDYEIAFKKNLIRIAVRDGIPE